VGGAEGTDGDAASGDRTGPSVCYVVHPDGSEQVHFDPATVEGLLAGHRFFWLDLDQPDEADFDVLRDVFGFHPLAVEDSESFDQRAKIDDYDDFIFIVVYGATPDRDRLVEVHCFYSERFLVLSTTTTAPPLPKFGGGIRIATRRSTSRRCCSTESSTAS
jgi:Mg2+ and Co2+ transporter CorA